jgi:F-type H+-transporting ATPase subunit b
MQIDWLTVAAQIVNFLVLVWLLKRFLYGPITAAMARREARIAERLSLAAEKQAAADREARSFRDERAALEQARERLLREAHEAADKERKALEQEARSAVEARKQEWLQQLATERETVLRNLRHRSTEAFYTLARRALDDLADTGLEDQVALGFARQLAGLDDAAAAAITAAADGRVRVRSRFELGAEARRQIDRAVHERLDPGIEVAYTVDAGLACGVVLEAGSQRLSWSLASYLDGFEAAVEKELAGA